MDAILDISKCSMMPEWHHSYFSRTIYALPESTKKKSLKSSSRSSQNFPKFFWTKTKIINSFMHMFSRIIGNKNYELLHAYVQCVYIVSAKYPIAPSKAVVGVDRPIKALSMHIQKPYKGIIV